MATRTLNRRALREQNDYAEPDAVDDAPDEDGDAPVPKVKKARARKSPVKAAGVKKPAKPRVRKRAVKARPVLFARWGVFDNAMKRLAVFDYKDRAGADAKLAEIRGHKTGTFVLLLVKEPAEPAPEAATPA